MICRLHTMTQTASGESLTNGASKWVFIKLFWWLSTWKTCCFPSKIILLFCLRYLRKRFSFIILVLNSSSSLALSSFCESILNREYTHLSRISGTGTIDPWSKRCSEISVQIIFIQIRCDAERRLHQKLTDLVCLSGKSRPKFEQSQLLRATWTAALRRRAPCRWSHCRFSGSAPAGIGIYSSSPFFLFINKYSSLCSTCSRLF